jgi:DNA modification methylase
VSFVVHHGDCRDVLRKLDANSVDSVVTDPPYNLASIVKRFGADGAAPAKAGATGVYARSSAGFMGKKWDSDVAFQVETWVEVYRVLKPGGHLLAFGGTRTYHRLATAIEDAGFEIRDQIGWLYGTGFPKSHDVAKAIDKELGVKGSFGEPKSAAHAGWIDRGRMRGEEGHEGYQRPWMQDEEAVSNNARQYIPGSPEAAQWSGWGTALKPAWEPIVVARKPLIGTVAENVGAFGTGALNIDGCRVGDEVRVAAYTSLKPAHGNKFGAHGTAELRRGTQGEPQTYVGRWPANVIHDGSDEVLAAFPEAPGQLADASATAPSPTTSREASATRRYTENGSTNFAPLPGQRRGDSGSAARFFYCAKASKADRNDGLNGGTSNHPTVKPTDLMRYLTRLVTPPGGTVLDPFTGSGSTGRGAMLEGFDFIGIEMEAPYLAIAEARIAAVMPSLELALADLL